MELSTPDNWLWRSCRAASALARAEAKYRPAETRGRPAGKPTSVLSPRMAAVVEAAGNLAAGAETVIDLPEGLTVAGWHGAVASAITRARRDGRIEWDVECVRRAGKTVVRRG